MNFGLQNIFHAAMQPFSHAAMQSCNHAIIHPCIHAIMQPCSHASFSSLFKFTVDIIYLLYNICTTVSKNHIENHIELTTLRKN
ncbi:MAG: hypothetical protein D8M61_12045 [Ignavibacteriae bacterium]|nr:hypothetical protein [Ignavibacteriota bacterium]